MVGLGGTIDSSPAGVRGAQDGGAVEPRSAVVDEGGLVVAWQEFTVRTAKSSRQGQAFGAIKHWLYPFLVVLPVF